MLVQLIFFLFILCVLILEITDKLASLNWSCVRSTTRTIYHAISFVSQNIKKEVVYTSP